MQGPPRPFAWESRSRKGDFAVKGVFGKERCEEEVDEEMGEAQKQKSARRC